MWLLHATTRELKQFFDVDIPAYAILSHTWGEEEVTFQDLATENHKKKKGYQKIENCCIQALKDELSYVWVDTCCIDKTSSAELSEAINSMFRWYSAAKICYAYLEDVEHGEDPFDIDSSFRSSRWFTRGWTLQEMIAPQHLMFFDKTWASFMDTKGSEPSAELLSHITGLPLEVLERKWPITYRIRDMSIACKLSWAAKRRTTRVEDMAYCLMGILEVNMPLLYGEGEKAFTRLQKAAMSKSDDISPLAWGYMMPWDQILYLGSDSLLTTSPIAFMNWPQCNLRHVRHAPRVHTIFTGHGLYIDLPMIPLDPKNSVWLAIIEDYLEYEESRCIGILVQQDELKNSKSFMTTIGCPPTRITHLGFWRMLLQMGKSARRTIYLQELSRTSHWNEIHPATGRHLLRYVWRLARFQFVEKFRDWYSHAPLALDKWFGRRQLVGYESIPLPTIKDGIIYRRLYSQFRIDLEPLYDAGFSLSSTYPPLEHFQSYYYIGPYTSMITTHVLELRCKGPKLRDVLAVFASKQGEMFAIRLQLKWGTFGAEDWTITFADWRLISDTAAAHHGNTASHPALYRGSINPLWKDYAEFLDPSTGACRHAHGATARTDPGRNRKFGGQADYTIQIHDGRHGFCHLRPENESEIDAVDQIVSVDRVSTDSCESDGSGEAPRTPGTNA